MEVVQICGEYLWKETDCLRSHQLYVPLMHCPPSASATVSILLHFLWTTKVSTAIFLWTFPIPQDNYRCIFILHGSKGKMNTRNDKEVK